MAERRKSARRFAVCIRNEGYEASLERNKLYVVEPDPSAEGDGDIRVIDESGEDYAFSMERFHLLTLPEPVEQTLLLALA